MSCASDTAAPPGEDEAGLLGRVRTGDRAAMDVLYRRHRDAAVRAARRVVDPTTAEDVASEAFLRVYTAVGAGAGPPQRLRPYLLTTVRNLAVSHVRHDRRYVWTDDLAALDAPVPAPDEATSPAEVRRVARAFASLPERSRRLLWHTAVEGRSHADTGRLLGVSANAVGVASHRARAALRRAYREA
jgi:RNA polymerase sigma factor (sigma-70 family)